MENNEREIEKIRSMIDMYPKAFKKANVSLCTYFDLFDETIMQTRIIKENGKVILKETEEIQPINYMNGMTWICMQQSRVYKSCTRAGYIPTRVTCRSPYEADKICIITWDIKPKR